MSSGGGHWAELRRLAPAWDGAQVVYVTTGAAYAQDVPGADLRTVIDANAKAKLRLVGLALGMLWHVLRTRPDVVVSTGAAPGYFAVRFGKLLGARTVWLDSIANAEGISVSGHLARRHCDLWL
ncbi:MAG: UDP-N-acetylglucosamine--LPS N-acetylglucosamine transferase, partial [Pseudomonadota bacterium]